MIWQPDLAQGYLQRDREIVNGTCFSLMSFFLLLWSLDSRISLSWPAACSVRLMKLCVCIFVCEFALQCFDTVGWAIGSNSSTLSKFKSALKSHLFTWLFSRLHQQLRSVMAPLNRFYVLWHHRNYRRIIIIIIIIKGIQAVNKLGVGLLVVIRDAPITHWPIIGRPIIGAK